MSEENEKIWLEPKVAIQIVNKILGALDGNKGDGKGITLNVPVVTIGKLVVYMGGNGTAESVEVSNVEVSEGQKLFQTKGQKLLPTERPSVESAVKKFELKQTRQREEKSNYLHKEIVAQVLKESHPDWSRSTLDSREVVVRQFFRFCFDKRGMFQLNELGKEDVELFLDAEEKKENSLYTKKSKKCHLLAFFEDLEKQGISSAISRYTRFWGKK